MPQSVKELEAKRDQLLASQAEVADKFNGLLNKKNGLKESSHLTM